MFILIILLLRLALSTACTPDQRLFRVPEGWFVPPILLFNDVQLLACPCATPLVHCCPPKTTRSWTGGMGLPLVARAREDGLGTAESADTYHI